MGTFLFNGGKRLTAAYFTLGCKLNFAETSTIASRLRECGVEDAAKGERPDICVVNTCSVTGMADKKARTLIRRVARQHPGTFLVVTGCYAQLRPAEVAAIEGVGLVLGSKEKHRVADFLEAMFDATGFNPSGVTVAVGEFGRDDSFAPSCSRGDRTRFFLKVQDGCDYFCTYCTIPYARGRSRSGSVADIVAQAREAAAEGGREIVITGVNIGDFGKNTGERLLDLLKALDGVEGIERFRISSIEPNLLTDEIIDWIGADSRAYMPHFHLPLQSGSDAVLRKMNRRYSTQLFAERVAHIREVMPDAFIGVDVIAGARGESAAEWERSLSFIRGLDVTRLHVFPYSERPGTAALLLDEAVPKEVRDSRAAELIAVSDDKLRSFMEVASGSVRPVLWETRVGSSGLMSGLTDNYIRVVAPLRDDMVNSVSRVRLVNIDPTRVETMTASHI